MDAAITVYRSLDPEFLGARFVEAVVDPKP
jgi:hypothetical protein